MLTTLAALLVDPAAACDFAIGAAHEVVANPADTTAPSAPEVPALSVKRGVAPTCDAFGTCQSTSCDGIGLVELTFAASTDDVSDPARVGYRLRVVEGSLPDGLTVDETRRADAIDGDVAVLTLLWSDEATDDQEPFDFTLGVTAVDEAGNESDEVTVAIDDPGSEAGGCSTAGRGAGVLGVLLALGAAARRRPARRPSA